MNQRLRFALAQLGRKPGGRDVLARLLSTGDLPGGQWRRLGQRTWRTGVMASTAWGKRARAAGSVTAWRSFRDEKDRLRGMWLEVMPLASAADARLAVGEAGSLIIRNQAVRVVEGSEVEVEPFAGASAVWAREARADGPHGPAITLTLAGAVGDFMVVVSASGRLEEGFWDWPLVSDIAARQARRLTGEAAG